MMKMVRRSFMQGWVAALVGAPAPRVVKLAGSSTYGRFGMHEKLAFNSIYGKVGVPTLTVSATAMNLFRARYLARVAGRSR